jgi:hypothetical protein
MRQAPSSAVENRGWNVTKSAFADCGRRFGTLREYAEAATEDGRVSDCGRAGAWDASHGLAAQSTKVDFVNF